MGPWGFGQRQDQMGLVVDELDLLERPDDEMVGWIYPTRSNTLGRLQTEPELTIRIPASCFRSLSNELGGERGIHRDSQQCDSNHMSSPSGKRLRRDSPRGRSDSTETEDYSCASFSQPSESESSDGASETAPDGAWLACRRCLGINYYNNIHCTILGYECQRCYWKR